jgi:hypothetical protein
MVRTRQPTIGQATDRVTGELDIVRTERDAFEAFLGRVREIQPNARRTPRTDGGLGTRRTAGSSPSMELRAVRRAYRETVMGVSHYEREYGDTLREGMAAELGPTLTGRIVDGERLTGTVCDVLMEATKQCIAEREEFRRVLRQERASLCTVAEELNDIETRLVELGDRIDATTTSRRLARIDETLRTIEQRCGDLATRRQERIHSRGTIPVPGVDSVSLPRYLYAEMDTITPALADIATQLDTIQYERTRCLR